MMYHLAHVNIATPKYTYEDPQMKGFVDELDPIHALADAAPGFVWRYITDDDDAEVKRVFAKDMILFNMSLWESVESLKTFVYSGDHLVIMRKRAEWFEPMKGPTSVLWWQPAGKIPTVTEAKHRLDCLEELGPSREAFTFRSAFDAPAGQVVSMEVG